MFIESNALLESQLAKKHYKTITVTFICLKQREHFLKNSPFHRRVCFYLLEAMHS